MVPVCPRKREMKEGAEAMRIFEGFQRGVNLGGWLSQCRSMEEAHFQGFIQKEDIARIASWGLGCPSLLRAAYRST